MALGQGFIYTPKAIAVKFATDPVFSSIASMAFLASDNYFPGLGSGLVASFEELPDEIRTNNTLIFIGLAGCVWPNGKNQYDSFQSYIDEIRNRDVTSLINQQLEYTLSYWRQHPDSHETSYTIESLLGSETLYLSIIRALKGPDSDEEFNLSAHQQAYNYLQQPEKAKDLIVRHLEIMWQEIYQKEWSLTQHLAEQTTEAFQDVDFSIMSLKEIIHKVTDRDMSKIVEGKFNDKVTTLVFTPTINTGPYLAFFLDFDEEEILRITFGIRKPEGHTGYVPGISRSELLVRLNALADDTRLHILKLVAEEGELCAQDFIQILNLSQSAASRHLRQLTANGFLIERRQEVAKCYTLSDERIRDTMKALEDFLL